jgi:hypothetical protein
VRHGIGWTPERSDTPLAGFAHGAAGIVGLVEARGATGERRFRTAALDTITYGAACSRPRSGLARPAAVERRRRGRPRTPMTAWCHGAAGIGLARMDSLAYWTMPERRIDVAARTTAARAPQSLPVSPTSASSCFRWTEPAAIPAGQRRRSRRRWRSTASRARTLVRHPVRRQGPGLRADWRASAAACCVCTSRIHASRVVLNPIVPAC